MNISLQRILHSNSMRLLNLQNSLAQLNPHNVLARGYAMVQDTSGKLVSDSKQLMPAQKVHITFAQGCADADISKIKSK